MEDKVEFEIDIEDDLYEKVEKAAKHLGISVEAYIGHAVKDYLDHLAAQDETTQPD